MEPTSIDAYDVIVAGGGPGGVAAAVAAARTGAKTLIVEREGCLGGGMTTMMICPFMSHLTTEGPNGEPRQMVNAGIYKEITDRMIAAGHAIDSRCIQFDDEYMKIALDAFVAEAGVTVLFHSALYDVEQQGGVVSAILAAHNSGPLRITGKVFIDATGDGLLAALAGAEAMFGNDAGVVMPMTTKFVVAGVDSDRVVNTDQLKKLAVKGESDEPALINTNVSCLAFRPNGRVHFNAIRVTGNTIDPFDLSRAEAEGRRRVENFVAWLKANVPGYENSYLEKMGAHIGVRESRRIVGDYVLAESDWESCARFDDGIACSSYGIDVHGQKQNECRHGKLPPGGYYQIPYRCLTPKGLENVLMASRSISADIGAHSSLRIMPTVMCIGQAAGSAAGLSLPGGDVRSVDIAALRARLEAEGAFLKNRIEENRTE